MTSILIQIGVGVLLGILSAWIKGPSPATFEQPRRPALKARLKARLKRSGWLPCVALAMLLQGCGILHPQTAIYVPSGEPVRIVDDIPRVRVEVIGPEGATLRTMTIPAGWYALPDNGE